MDDSLHAKKPVSLLKQDIKTDLSNLFLGLTQAVVSTPFSEWKGALTGALKVLGAFKIKEPDPGTVAWYLIQRSLTDALYHWAGDSLSQLKRDLPDADKLESKALVGSLDLAKLESSELAIDPSFFDRPQNFSLLTELKDPLIRWLGILGMAQAPAASMVLRFPSYFALALHRQWGEKRDDIDYSVLKQAFDTPFFAAVQREREWNQYRAWLQKQVHEPVFDAPFGLDEVYQPLRAWVELEESGDEKQEGAVTNHTERCEKQRPLRQVAYLHELLDKWLDNTDDRTDGLRMLMGGPGSGKSSFSKVYAAYRAEKSEHLPVLFVPLHHLRIKKDLVDAIGHYVRAEKVFKEYNPLNIGDEGEPRLFVIFDGLDELAMQGVSVIDDANAFVSEVKDQLRDFNGSELRLQVLITSRITVGQSAKKKLRGAGKIIQLLPYWVPESERWTDDENHKPKNQDKAWKLKEDPGEFLYDDQRDNWWISYGKVSRGEEANPYKGGMPEILNQKWLEEITAQPLLNYLVAMSYEADRIDFKDGNLNIIYRDLVKSVFKRSWGDGNPHLEGTDLDFDAYHRTLEEISLAVWHSGGRTASVPDIEKRFSGADKKRLEAFQKSAQEGVTRLLTAFYFKQSGRDKAGDPTFEFTHKSFGEYLMACRVVRLTKLMVEEINTHQNDGDRGWDDTLALTKWAEMCGPQALTFEVAGYIQREVAGYSKSAAQQWQNELVRLIGVMLRWGMPMDKVELERPNYKEMDRQARNAEEALLVMLNACALVTHEHSEIDWPDYKSAGNWIARLRGQLMFNETSLALSSLSLIKMETAIFLFQVFHKADLSNANLRGAHFHGADLRGAELSGVNLRDVNFYKASLFRARLIQADLRRADLSRADLGRADLRGADLRGADLSGADLRGADLRGADLSGADLSGAYLRGQAFRHGKMREIELDPGALNEAKIDNETKLPPDYQPTPEQKRILNS